MKDGGLLFMTGAVCLFCVLLGVVLGDTISTAYERTRIYEKCLVEQESLPHKNAVLVCKERVK
jgi:hypothetical protein